ncbi:hypothetical protein [Streptomyces sp. NPDC007856]|uniref:hypothetical protein n=1 Tax=Streptomyces sp. NPDC007856 TaxID=3364781 RepID=UPI00368C032D
MADRSYPHRDRALAQLRRQEPALRFRSTPNLRVVVPDQRIVVRGLLEDTVGVVAEPLGDRGAEQP